MNREAPSDLAPTWHANLPNNYADWLMNLTEFRANDFIDSDVIRTPYGVRLSTRAFEVLCDFADGRDGAIRRHRGGSFRDQYQMWFDGTAYAVFAESVGPLGPPSFEPLWDEDETSLLVWAAQARFFNPLTVFASDVVAGDARRDDDGNERPYQGAAAIITYLRSVDADRTTIASAVDIDPDTADDLLAAAAWAARVNHAKRRRDDAIHRCVRYDLASKRDLAHRVGLSGHAAITRIVNRETPTDEI